MSIDKHVGMRKTKCWSCENNDIQRTLYNLDSRGYGHFCVCGESLFNHRLIGHGALFDRCDPKSWIKFKSFSLGIQYMLLRKAGIKRLTCGMRRSSMLARIVTLQDLVLEFGVTIDESNHVIVPASVTNDRLLLYWCIKCETYDTILESAIIESCSVCGSTDLSECGQAC